MSAARLAPWFSRLVLLAAMLLLAFIGLKFIGDPAGAAAVSSTVLGSPLAVTNMRASFGAFPLGSALFVLFCLLGAGRRIGLVFVATVMGTALAARIFGVLVDGTLAESLRLILVEALLLCLCGAALAGEAVSGSPQGARTRLDAPGQGDGVPSSGSP